MPVRKPSEAPVFRFGSSRLAPALLFSRVRGSFPPLTDKTGIAVREEREGRRDREENRKEDTEWDNEPRVARQNFRRLQLNDN